MGAKKKKKDVKEEVRGELWSNISYCLLRSTRGSLCVTVYVKREQGGGGWLEEKDRHGIHGGSEEEVAGKGTEVAPMFAQDVYVYVCVGRGMMRFDSEQSLLFTD